MDQLSDLNPEQRAAVTHVDGPLLVVAGAGTGKTQVITRRIAYLIEQGHAKGQNILALTFTEKAAREMAERLYELIGWESYQVPVMTFHAFGTELLGRYASHIGRSIRGGLINDIQKVLLLLQHLNRISLSYYESQSDLYSFVEGIVAYIGTLQNSAISVDTYDAYVTSLEESESSIHPQDLAEQRDIAALYRLYETIKLETGTYDYNDQLEIPLRILRERPNVAARLADEYRYVLVDEYQDTNAVQDELLRAIVAPNGNIFAVGDDDQAIYGFRGARIDNILDFAAHFKVKTPVALMQNYRSGQAILDAAYRLIQHNNPDRLEARLKLSKRLVAQHSNAFAEVRLYRTLSDEHRAVLDEITERVARGEQPQSIAVLAATHAPLKDLAKLLKARGIGFALSSTVNIFEQPELINLWYLLRWIELQADDESIGHVIMGPFVGWSVEQYRQLLERARTQLISIEEALHRTDSEAAIELLEHLDTWRSWARHETVSHLVFKLVFKTGVSEHWREAAKSSPRIIRVYEDLQRLLEQMQDYETVALDPKLGTYLATFPKPPLIEVTEAVGDDEGVQLLTVHSSKGLEFDTVYIVGCTQRAWSLGRSLGLQVPTELLQKSELPPEHEYRRLMYVAVTRARKEVFVSAATETASGSRQAVSPFLGELFGDELPKVTNADDKGVSVENSLQKLQQFYPLQEAYSSPRLPFETTDGWIELGVNDLGSYDYCPYDFYLEKVLGLRQPFGPQLAFGMALHAVFEAYYRSRLHNMTPSIEELETRLDELWSDRGYEQREIADHEHALARSTLRKFYARETGARRVVRGVEVPIKLEVPEAKLHVTGRIDALFELEGGLEVRDYKTGRRKTDPEKLSAEAKANFQLRSYALALQSMTGDAPQRVVLDYVVTGVEGTAELTETILKNHRDKLAKLAERIRSRDFKPTVNAFHTCAAVKYYGTGESDEE